MDKQSELHQREREDSERKTQELRKTLRKESEVSAMKAHETARAHECEIGKFAKAKLGTRLTSMFA